MKLSVPPWLRDRKVQIAIAVAAAAGLYGLARRRGSAGPAADSDGGGGGGTPFTPATFDSSGTDIYNAIQSVSQGWSNDLRAFTDQLTAVNDKLSKLPSTGTGKDPAKDEPKKPAPKKDEPKKSSSSKQYVTVTKFTSKNPSWSSTLSGIASHYKTSVSNLLKLNPNIKNANIIQTGQKIRVK